MNIQINQISSKSMQTKMSIQTNKEESEHEHTNKADIKYEHTDNLSWCQYKQTRVRQQAICMRQHVTCNEQFIWRLSKSLYT